MFSGMDRSPHVEVAHVDGTTGFVGQRLARVALAPVDAETLTGILTQTFTVILERFFTTDPVTPELFYAYS